METLPAIPSSSGYLAHDPSVANVLGSYLSKAERIGVGQLQLPDPITKEHRAMLQARHRQIAKHFAAFDKKAIAVAVLDAATCYRNFFKSEEASIEVKMQVVTKYVKELQGIPTWACLRACNVIRMGQAPGISMVHPFSAIQLKVLAESYVERLREEATSISQVLMASVAPQPQSPEIQAKVKTALGRLAFSLGRAARKQIDAEVAERGPRLRQANQRSILAEYEKQGEAPKYSGGILISPALLKSIEGKR